MKKLILIFLLSTTLFATEEKRILIIGDSLTAGYGVSKKDAYPHQLEVLLKKKNPQIKVVAAGVSGSTSASAYNRLKWHLKGKPHILILALGGNDGLRGLKPSSIYKNLEKTIKLAKENKLKVYLAGMKLSYNYGEQYRQEFAEVFKNLIKKYKIGEIPFLLEGVGGIKKLNLADGMHPNEEGHKILAKNVARALEKEL